MIVPPAGVRVLVATQPIDFRKGADSLAAIVEDGAAPRPVLRDDLRVPLQTRRPAETSRLGRHGLVLLWKRPESGAFRWPPVTDGVMRLSAAQLVALLDGLDWRRMHVPCLGRPKTAQ